MYLICVILQIIKKKITTKKKYINIINHNRNKINAPYIYVGQHSR